MKKIGILTYHYVINEGAMLQAYALQQICRNIFNSCDVENINYESLREKKGEFITCFHPLKKFNLKLAIENLILYSKLNRFKQYFNLSKPRYLGDNYFKAIKFLNRRKYDLIIVGSDEVWKKRPPNIYWLGPEILSEKVSYAASAHKALSDELREEEKRFIIRALKEFKLIGVRDEHTFNMVESFLGRESKGKLFLVLDPVFLYNFSKEGVNIEKIFLKNKIDLNYPIAIFALENELASRMARKFLKKRNYQIVSIGHYNQYADFNLFYQLNPLEWMFALKKSNFCVTDRFHATAFCIKNKTKFLAIDHLKIYKKFKSKIKQLLEEFGLVDRLVDLANLSYDYNKFVDKMELALKPLDENKLEEILKQKKIESLNFLKSIKELL